MEDGPEIYEKSQLFNKAPKEALLSSLLILEELVRLYSGSNHLYGYSLIGNAFGKEGPLRFENINDRKRKDGQRCIPAYLKQYAIL